MRQISLSLFTLLLFAISCKHKQTISGDYIINGKIEGGVNGEMIICRQQTMEAKPDTAYLTQDGSFSFKGKIEEPIAASIYFPASVSEGQQQAINLFVELGTIEITAKKEQLLGAVVKGGDCNNELQQLVTLTKPYGEKMMALSDSIKKLYSANNMADAQVLQQSAIAMEKEQNNAVAKLIKDNPKNYASGYLAYQLNSYETNVDTAQVAYNNLDASIQEAYYGKKLKGIIDVLKSTAVGTKAPEFKANTSDGKEVSLSSFQGKYLLLDFWASWCGPCRQENPNVVKAYNEFKNKNFTVLSFSLDDNKDAWQQAVTSDNLSWTQVSDLKGWQSPIAGTYGIQSIPSNLLIDPSGKIVGKDLRGEDLINALNGVLK